MEDYLPPLLSLVHDCLCWDYFTLAGHSMGAALAILLSVALPPAAVRRLVLIEGMGPNSSVPGTIPEKLRTALEHNRIAATKPRRVYPSLETAIQARVIGNGLFELTYEAARTLVARGTRAATAEEAERGGMSAETGVVFTHDPLLRNHTVRRFSEDDVLECLAAIPCPTLLIYAERGIPAFAQTEIAKEGLQKRKNAIQDFREVRCDGEGHHVHLEAPHKVLPALSSFLRHAEPALATRHLPRL
jgi:pimeloyl-ACP methyl ester carboxylesterase